MGAYSSTILDEITREKVYRETWGQAVFRRCDKEVPANKPDKEVPER